MLFADVGVLQDVEPFRVRGHQAVLDAVVYHLYEVAGTRGAAVEIALLGGATQFFATRSAINRAAPGGERLEDRIEVLHDVRLATDHLAVAALKSPHAAAGSAIHIMD